MAAQPREKNQSACYCWESVGCDACMLGRERQRHKETEAKTEIQRERSSGNVYVYVWARMQGACVQILLV